MRTSQDATTNGAPASGDDYAGLLIDRLAAAIIDDSLPLKEVERDLRGSVAQVAIHRRGLGKRETAHRCGVTEKSIENYLKEARNNPKSPEREIARVLQDEMLSLEEVWARVAPVIGQTRNFTLDDAKRCLEKLIRTGEVQEYPEHKYRAVARPSIRYPNTVEAHRELVDQKARDLDYVVLTQKEVTESDLERRDQRYSRVVRDTNLVRIDFTVDVAEADLPALYEKLSEAVAKATMGHEKKKGVSRVRLLLAMRSVATLLLLATLVVCPWAANRAGEGSWELDRVAPGGPAPEVHDPALPPRGDGEGADEGDDSGEGGGLEIAPDEREALDGVPFRRGDVNSDSLVDLSDVVHLVRYLRRDLDILPCADAADVNDNGSVTLLDAVHLFQYLFLGEHFAVRLERRAVPDSTPDELGCEDPGAI